MIDKSVLLKVGVAVFTKFWNNKVLRFALESSREELEHERGICELGLAMLEGLCTVLLLWLYENYHKKRLTLYNRR